MDREFCVLFSSEVDGDFYCFGGVQLEVVVSTPVDCAVHCISVVGFVIIGDEADYCCVVCVLEYFY